MSRKLAKPPGAGPRRQCLPLSLWHLWIVISWAAYFLIQGQVIGASTSGAHTKAADFNMRYRGTTTSTLGNYQYGVKVDLDALDKNLANMDRVLENMQRPFDDNYAGYLISMDRAAIKRLREQLAETRALGEDFSVDRARREAEDEWTDEEEDDQPRTTPRDWPQNITLDRHGRSLSAFLSVGSAVVGTVRGIYRQIQLQKMRREMEEHQGKIDDLYMMAADFTTTLGAHAIHLAELENWAQELDEGFYQLQYMAERQAVVAHYMSILREQVQGAANIMDLLIHQQLSHTALKTGEMRKVLTLVKKEAATIGYVLLVNNAAEAFQAKASFVMTEYGFMAILHLPLSKANDEMDLFEYVPIPIVIDEKHHMTVQPRLSVVAVSKDKTYFRAMSLSELTMCDKLGSLHLCENANMQTNKAVALAYKGQRNDHLCAWFIYTSQFHHIRSACQFYLEKPAEQGFALSPYDFVFVGTEPHQGFMVCTGKTDATFQVDGPTLVTVPIGCVARTDYFTATAGDKSLLEEASVRFIWPKSKGSPLLEDIDLELLATLEKTARKDIPVETVALRAYLRTEAIQQRIDSNRDRNLITTESVTGIEEATSPLYAITYGLWGSLGALSTSVAGFAAHTLRQRTTTATRNKALLALTVAKMVQHLALHKIPTGNLAQNIGDSLSRLEEGLSAGQDLQDIADQND